MSYAPGLPAKTRMADSVASPMLSFNTRIATATELEPAGMTTLVVVKVTPLVCVV